MFEICIRKKSLYIMNKKSTTTSVTGSIPSATTTANVFYTTWEPKTPNRFLVYMFNEKKERIIESYLIKYIDRPGFTRQDGKKVWHPIRMHLYEPIVPGQILFRCLGAGVFDIQVTELGPVGDVIEVWHIPQCRFQEVKASPLNWSEHGLMEIQCEIDWTEIIVKNGDSEFKIQRKQ